MTRKDRRRPASVIHMALKGAILKDKPCPMAVFEILRKMTPLRQVEVA